MMAARENFPVGGVDVAHGHAAIGVLTDNRDTTDLENIHRNRNTVFEDFFFIGVQRTTIRCFDLVSVQDHAIAFRRRDVGIIQQLVKERPTFMPTFDEFALLRENIDYLAQEFDCRVEVFRAEDEERYDPQRKAGVAKPYKPGIFIE